MFREYLIISHYKYLLEFLWPASGRRFWGKRSLALSILYGTIHDNLPLLDRHAYSTQTVLLRCSTQWSIQELVDPSFGPPLINTSDPRGILRDNQEPQSPEGDGVPP